MLPALGRFRDLLARISVQIQKEMGTCMVFQGPDSALRIMAKNE